MTGPPFVIRPDALVGGGSVPATPKPPDVAAQMRTALEGARAAGATPEQLTLIREAWTREVQNVNEAEQLATEPASYAQQALGGVSALIKDIPGAEAVAAGARGVVRGQPYREALSDIRSGYEAAPALARIPNRIIGGGIASAAIPIKSPALSGATYGAALNAAQADPDAGLAERALDTALGAGVGWATGKVGDMLVTGGRAKMAPRYDVAKAKLTKQGRAAASPLYREALDEGAASAMTPRTPEMDAFLGEPKVQEIVNGLREMGQFRNLPVDDPTFLDAIYKALSDTQTGIGKGLQVQQPGKPNLLRAQGDDLAALKSQALEAISGPSGPMPTYATAVDVAREGFRNVDALKRGYNLSRVETGQTLASGPLEKWGQTAFDDAMRGATPEMRQHAATGVASGLGRKLDTSSLLNLVNPMKRSLGREAIGQGGGLLRSIEGIAAENAAEPLTQATLLDYLERLAASAATPNRGRTP